MELMEQHERELRTMLEEKDSALNARMDQHAATALEDAQAQRESIDQAHQALVQHLRETAEAEAARHREEAQSAEREARRLHEQYGPLREEHDEAAEALR